MNQNVDSCLKIDDTCEAFKHSDCPINNSYLTKSSSLNQRDCQVRYEQMYRIPLIETLLLFQYFCDLDPGCAYFISKYNVECNMYSRKPYIETS